MDQQSIYQTLTEILQEVFDNPEIVASPDLSANDVPEWDSFNHINIVVASEMRFGIKFKTAEIESLRNVGEFVTLIAHKLSTGAVSG